MKAAFLDYETMGPGLKLDGLRAVVSSLQVWDNTSDAELAERLQGIECVFTNKIRLTEELLRKVPQLRFIGLTATGSDNIDLKAARAHGIVVTNVRNYCTNSVAEHVIGVMLMLAHSLSHYHASVRAGDWQKSDIPFLLAHPVVELHGKTLGIVGYGALGKGVANIARALGMQILVSARRGQSPAPEGRVVFDELLASADVISLHCPLTNDTRNLIGATELAAMKSTAMLINTARGGLVDSAALAAALTDRTIAAAAVDVLPTEPPVDGDPLLDYTGHNLVVTPHIAWSSDAARQNAIDELARNTSAFIAGENRNQIT
ncbi:MAG TPA: D-2-hydroxyacid dehydrogenase [Woeseiaceae bacterium]|nr:D-2-hydroxyacid dehydrogenase [Woeseiaceae bacterium]